MLWWEETLRWMESPSRRLLLLAYLLIGLSLLSMFLSILWLFIYQRIVVSVIARDTEYAWQLTNFLGRGRNFGLAITSTPNGRISKLILFGKPRIEWRTKRSEPDPRYFRARMMLLVKEGPEANVHASLLVRRVAEKIDIAKLFVKAGIGFPDPAMTGQAAAIFYPLTMALPRNDRIHASVLPMFDRPGLDLDAEAAVGFRAFRVLVPWLRYALHPVIVRFTWRWMYPRINEPLTPGKEKSHGRQVLRNRIIA